MTLHPIAYCSKCKKQLAVEELKLLPEVEQFARTSSLALLHGKPLPPPNDESVLKKKYGYGFKDLFCPQCLSELIENSRHLDQQDFT